MPTFKDALGREWTIEITVGEIKRLRKEMNIDLLAVFEDKSNLLITLANDPVLLVDCISVLCTDAIIARGMDADKFAQGLVGDGIDNAVNCLVEALGNFSRPHQRGMIQKLWAGNLAMEKKMDDRLTTALPSLMAEADRQIDQAVEKLSESFSDSLQSLVSNHGASHSEN